MLKDNLKPLAENVIIEPIFKDKVSDSGIILSTKEEVESKHANVIAVGEDCKHVKVGDSIIYEIPKGMKLAKWNTETGNPKDVRGVIHETMVLAIIEE